MNNNHWFSIGPKERLSLWREFRKTLGTMNLEDALNATVAWWSFAPISSNVFNAYESDDWPTPWELIWIGEYDEDNIALGMAYTLQLENTAKCELAMVQERKENTAKLVVLVNDEYVLNYEFNQLTKIDVLADCDILHKKTLT